MKISSTILLNFLFLLVVSCSSSAKDVSGDSSLENIEESSLIDECLEDCSNSGFSLLDDDTPEMEESNSVFQIKGLGCNSLQYGTGFFVEENISAMIDFEKRSNGVRKPMYLSCRWIYMAITDKNC